MNQELKLLALLVHRGLVDADAAKRALASGSPGQSLVEQGACTDAQWQGWLATEGGVRPQLTRYELGDMLGEGATARVFRAVDKTDRKRVALKVLRSELIADQGKVDSFVKEAKLLLSLSHPHVVKGVRVAKEGATIYFAMEELPGVCLQDALRESGRLDEGSALAITADIASALSALHGRGLVHRDVKPGNVIWSQQRGAVLIDLGFAVEGVAAASKETTAGTVHYIAPEQARGNEGLDVRADIYALGATLYHLVTGELPFEGATNDDVLRKQVLESLSGERIRALSLSPQTHYFIEKMMAKEREIRFQDPAQLESDVRAFLASQEAQRQLELDAEADAKRTGFRRRRRP